MAVLRKRRVEEPLHFRDGGAVPMSADVVAEPTLDTVTAAPTASAMESVAAPEFAPRSEADSAVLAAVHATLAAEGLQREAARLQREMEQRPAPPLPLSAIEQHINALPISEHKRRFLRARPDLLEPSRSQMLAQHYADAIRSGIKDDSAELDEYLLNGVQRDLERLEPTPGPIEAHSPPSAPAPSRRPSIPMTAPPSREVPMSDGRMFTDRVTLSAEERQMAHLSYRGMPPAEAERIYAEQKLKIRRERAAGRYPDERG